MPSGGLLTAGFLSIITGTIAAVDPDSTITAGPDYTGIALVISAIAALITAIGGVVIGIKKNSGDEIDSELKQLLLKAKLKAELEAEDHQDGDPP